jgi:LAO/AO transport system kinase
LQSNTPKDRSINPNLKNLKRSVNFDIDQLFEGIRKGDIVQLSKAITLIESTNPRHQESARTLIDKCLPLSGNSIRIGITGTPGVGKSTFIESYGSFLIENSKRIAVLTIDPSSQVSKGSILGDKTRMEKLSSSEMAFIRPSPAGDSLGGVARKTRETIILCEAAGFERILIETVGVGQSETAVHSMVDLFLLLLLPGGGDELQGIKRGIMEMADIILVNKSDDDRIKLAKQTRRDYKNAMHLHPPKENGWIVKVLNSSGLTGTGIEELEQEVQNFKQHTSNNKSFFKKREKQASYWFEESINQQLLEAFNRKKGMKELMALLRSEVTSNKISPFHAAEKLIKNFVNQ